MNLSFPVILRAGIIWGIAAVVLAFLGSLLGGILPAVEGLALGTYALLMAGVHYPADYKSDILYALLGGALSGFVAGLFLVLLQFLPIPLPSGAPSDIVGALVSGLVAGFAGALGYRIIQRF